MAKYTFSAYTDYVKNYRRDIVDYHFEKLRKTITENGRQVLEINIRYPVFEGVVCGEAMNSFYLSLAEKYCAYAEKESAKKAAAALGSEPGRRAFGEILIPKVIAADNERYISVILDVTSYDGIFAKERRLSQVWDTETGYMVKYDSVIRLSERKIADIIERKLEGELLSGDIHDYYKGCKRLCRRYFSSSDFFVTDRGVVFYYQSGLLCPQNEGAVCFTIEKGDLAEHKKSGPSRKEKNRRSKTD